MSVFFRPLNSNNVFHFFEDKNLPNNIKTISYELGADNSVIGKWEKKGTISQLMGAIKSVSDGKAEILSKSDLEAIFSV